MTSGPINLQLKSFAKAEDANEICDLLNKEGGVKYTVAPDNHLGFTVKRNQANTPQKQKVSKKNKSKPTAYRQSIKGFIPHFLEMGLGALLIANPYIVMGWIFAFLNIQTIPEWFSLHGSEVCRLVGFFVLLYGLRFIYSYYSVNHYFDVDGVVLKKGIIAQEQVQIRFRRHKNNQRSSRNSGQTARHWYGPSCLGEHKWGSRHHTK